MRGGRIAVVLVGLGAGCGRLGFDDDPCAEVPEGCTGETFECAGEASCYLRCTADLAWSAAAAACQAWGGELATIETIEENACLAARTPQETVWIGLEEETVGAWTWVSGSPSAWRNWRSDQPDDVGYNGETIGVDCARLNNDGGNTWLDEPCTTGLEYFCER